MRVPHAVFYVLALPVLNVLMATQAWASPLRGTSVPWEIFFLVVQYAVIYAVCRHMLRQRATRGQVALEYA